MTTEQRGLVVAVFQDRGDAQEAIRDLRAAGFREDEIGIASRDGDRSTGTVEVVDEGTMAGEGAVAGAAAGAGIGGLWAIAISAGLLPAIGPVIAGGLLMSILASAAGGAAAGGLVGALIGLGIPEEEARFYDTEFRAGRTVVTVQAGDRYDEAFAICNRRGAYNANATMQRT